MEVSVEATEGLVNNQMMKLHNNLDDEDEKCLEDHELSVEEGLRAQDCKNTSAVIQNSEEQMVEQDKEESQAPAPLRKGNTLQLTEFEEYLKVDYAYKHAV